MNCCKSGLTHLTGLWLRCCTGLVLPPKGALGSLASPCINFLRNWSYGKEKPYRMVSDLIPESCFWLWHNCYTIRLKNWVLLGIL